MVLKNELSTSDKLVPGLIEGCWWIWQVLGEFRYTARCHNMTHITPAIRNLRRPLQFCSHRDVGTKPDSNRHVQNPSASSHAARDSGGAELHLFRAAALQHTLSVGWPVAHWDVLLYFPWEQTSTDISRTLTCSTTFVSWGTMVTMREPRSTMRRVSLFGAAALLRPAWRAEDNTFVSTHGTVQCSAPSQVLLGHTGPTESPIHQWSPKVPDRKGIS